MSEPDNKGPSRRDFIKATTGIVGSLIGLAFGIPAIGYLIASAVSSSSSWQRLSLRRRCRLFLAEKVGAGSLYRTTCAGSDTLQRTGTT